MNIPTIAIQENANIHIDREINTLPRFEPTTALFASVKDVLNICQPFMWQHYYRSNMLCIKL